MLTSLADSIEIAKRLHRKAEGFIYGDGTTELRVTSSLGIAQLRDHQPDKLLSMADQALYMANARGRNRVEISRKT